MPRSDKKITDNNALKEIVPSSRHVRAPRPGRYRHYKGNLYEVLGIAYHSETEEPLVVYRQLYGDHCLWVRPLEMFLNKLIVDGQEISRFEYLP